MGCTASRLDNEDTVRRCKERRRLMKEAVDSRHHLASAHSDYLNSLRLTGSALTRFAQGEPLAVSDHTPPILLLRTYPIPPPSTATSLPPPTPQPPPPPPRLFSSSPPSPTIASSKLPHILSDSTPVSTPSSFRKPGPAPAPAPAKYYPHIPMNSTYATTPSQSSSAWDWENFYPPSPPDSEFFDRLRAEREEMKRQQHHLPREEVDEEEVEEEEGIHGEREEIHCRDWDERYSGTTSSTTECDGENEDEEERESRSDRIAARSDYGGSDPSRVAPSEIGSSAAAEVKTARRERSEAGSSSAGWNGRDNASSAAELKMVVRHRNLAEIVAALQEYFVKVADAGEGVSSLLETGRAQFERSFRQLKSK